MVVGTTSLRRLLFTAVLLVLALMGVASPAGAADHTFGELGDLADEPRVLFLGMAGVEWGDVTERTPALLRLAEQGTIGSNVARSLRPAACPADGWIAISAGTRAADTNYDECRVLTDPKGAEGSRAVASVTADGWDDFVEATRTGGYSANPGSLGDALAKSGLLSAGFGPGSVIMLADSAGKTVGPYSALPGTDAAGQDALTAELSSALASNHLVVLDAGSVRDGADQPTSRAEQVAAVDARVMAALSALDAALATEREAGIDRPTTVLAVSLADAGAEPRLQVAIASHLRTDSERFEPRLLTSSGTRQPGYVQTHDFAATVVDRLSLTDSVPRQAFVGSLLSQTGEPSTAAYRIDVLRDDALKSVAVRAAVPPFYAVFITANLALYAAISFGLTRVGRRLKQDGGSSTTPAAVSARILPKLRIVGLMMAAVPVASYLANLTPWWRCSMPGLAVTGLLLGWAALITALCLLGPWRNWMLGPLGLVAGLTMAVLALDVITGARLQLTSLMGTQALVAGRFYGFNNTAFALLITSSLLVSLAVTNPLIRRGKRLWAAGIIAVIGIFTTAIDGLPSIGADFGGPPAFIPGFALLTLMAAGVRITWRRVVSIGALTVVLVTGLLVADWLRPVDQRTHLGNFFQTVLDGGVWTVIGRKLDQNLQNIFGSWFTLLAFAGLFLVLLALGRPLRAAARHPEGGTLGWLSAKTDLRKISAQVPLFRPTMIALALTHAIGFAVNDSGILIPAIGIAAAIPLLIELFSNWISLRQKGHEPHALTRPERPHDD